MGLFVVMCGVLQEEVAVKGVAVDKTVAFWDRLYLCVGRTGGSVVVLKLDTLMAT